VEKSPGAFAVASAFTSQRTSACDSEPRSGVVKAHIGGNRHFTVPKTYPGRLGTVGGRYSSRCQAMVAYCWLSLLASVAAGAACPAGTQIAGGACAPCVPGTYGASPTAASCLGCPTGKYASVAGAKACADCGTCAGGLYRAGCAGGSAGTCEQCLPGTYKEMYAHTKWDDVCLDCPGGTHQTNAGALACHACADGKYARMGHTVCFHCPSGKYGKYPGSVECTDCAPGSHAVQPTATGCDQCPPGKFQQLSGQFSCTECEVNKYQPVSGATHCASCGYCKVANSTGATTCDVDRHDCRVSPWGAWGACSHTCHEGVNTRTRSILVQPRCGGSPCPVLVLQKMCMDRVCKCNKVCDSTGSREPRARTCHSSHSSLPPSPRVTRHSTLAARHRAL
jgi:hypothetical protein